MSILDTILAHKRTELAARRREVPLPELEADARRAPPPRDFARALVRGGAKRPRVIAEIKRASPSAGVIRAGADAVDIARQYRDAGAAAVSVLTDEMFFSGSLTDLERVRAGVDLPLLRKDFVLDPYQVMEARASGADAVLLIVAALGDAQLRELLGTAHEWGMCALCEVHDAAEAERATRAGAQVIGVNHRNLKTFEMDMDLFLRLRPLFPAGSVLVAESGIKTAADVARVAEAGADAILVGEGLMRKPSPGDALRELLS